MKSAIYSCSEWEKASWTSLSFIQAFLLPREFRRLAASIWSLSNPESRSVPSYCCQDRPCLCVKNELSQHRLSRLQDWCSIWISQSRVVCIQSILPQVQWILFPPLALIDAGRDLRYLLQGSAPVSPCGCLEERQSARWELCYSSCAALIALESLQFNSDAQWRGRYVTCFNL